MPRVTVAIAALNASRYIGETLDSVAAQSYRDFEIVVVDDGSTDGTAEIAERKPYTRVVRRRAGGPAGPATARNEAIRAGAGELIAVLDADDLWHPDKLELQVAELDRSLDTVLVATGVEPFGGSAPAAPALTGGEVTAALLRVNFVTASAVLFRRSAFERAGGFDPDSELIAVEDYDLWLRLSLLGRFAVVPRILTLRRVHDSNLSRDHLMLARRTLRAVEKFATLPESARFEREIAGRRSELCYLIGRALLSRGERGEGRRYLRTARGPGALRAGRALALEAVSYLPSSWLLGLHRWRADRRDARAG